MEDKFHLKQIGSVIASKSGFSIKIDKEYLPALENIAGFSHLQIIWWGHLYEKPQFRAHLISDKPYKKGPDKIGVFATRSPVRPNPLLITTISVISIDYENGLIHTPYIDAENGSSVLDIKPYHLYERVRDCTVPQWCGHWPQWNEDSATFNWQNEFNF
jgi:tRNA (adenine37-N6)-methyltransferase